MIGLRVICSCLVAVCLAGTPAMAQTSPSMVERQVASQGYEVIISETTWLGRLRILAVRGDLLREIVIGPGTGEVMRDVVYEIPGLGQTLAGARIGTDGRRIVDLQAIGGMGQVASGLTDPQVVGSGSPEDPGAAAVGDDVKSSSGAPED